MSSKNLTPMERNHKHDALAVFLGHWEARGTSYGDGQDDADPRANGVPWISTHTGHWHTGKFFLIQDERARPGGAVFDTLSIMGVDAETGVYFARTFENHGFYRHYKLSVDGKVWTLTGETERATTTFSEDNRRQDIIWEWRPNGRWLPLCERVATRTD